MRQFASIILVDPRGWILLQERDEHPVIDPERWGFVGGHVDEGEDPEAAAYRELEEETGLRMVVPNLQLWRETTVFHEGYGTHDTVWVYIGLTAATDADITVGEGRQIVFVDPAQIPNLPLGAGAAQILPDFFNSNFYQELLP
ncbi:NUDIX hydrolase [Nocardioides sp. WS12]|uniref:NUDIX domain-containing protein n=1 Tax=Nocardioides sp. WS12 TaxID=2486272 RepID=UPI0015F8243D|nr:NUDIX hydrolase [Nocardioides sp. WS12]